MSARQVSSKDDGQERVWRLASDVVITPVEEFPAEFIEKVAPRGGIPPGHYGIERKKVRSFPKIVNQDVVDVLNYFGEKGATYENALRYFMKERRVKREELHPKMEKMVKTFIHSNILVEGGARKAPADESVEPSFRNGDHWLSYKILENVHCLVDSEIYKVAPITGGETRALKIMQKRFPNREMRKKIKERLQREFDLIKRINHPNVVKLWEQGTVRSRTYGILDWVDGPSVRSYAHKSDTPADDSKLISLAMECLEALDAVHKYGYLHGDVHTGNFMVKRGHVCLIDFGLSRPIDLKPGEETRYAEGGVISYMPPEYVRRAFENKKGLWGSVAGEIYSSAIIVYSLFCRQYPYEWSFYRKDYMKSILNDPPKSFAEWGRASWPELEGVLGRAMAKNPEDRFASVEEFLKALGAVQIPVTAP